MFTQAERVVSHGQARERQQVHPPKQDASQLHQQRLGAKVPQDTITVKKLMPSLDSLTGGLSDCHVSLSKLPTVQQDSQQLLVRVG